jgi:NMD protein affecting ribosome stability and mRNA decay
MAQDQKCARCGSEDAPIQDELCPFCFEVDITEG